MPMPPSPSMSPREQTFGWMTRPYELLARCRQEVGDVFTIDFRGHGQYVLFSDPEHIHQILTGDPAVFHAANGLLEPFLGAHSLLLLEEERHKRERRLMMPHFSRRQIHGWGDQIEEVADRMIDGWRVGEEMPMRETAQSVALGLIDRLVFGLDGEANHDRHDALHRCFDEILSHPHFNIALIGQFGERLAGSPAWQQLQESLAEMDRLVREEIAERRATGRRGDDIMSLLMDAEYEDGESLSDDELRDELVTLLATGHETTATSLAWAVHWVWSHPPVLERLRAELATLGPDASPSQIAELDYLQSVVLETLRINPVVPIIARELQEPVQIAGYELPAGVTVAPVIYLLHRREDLYDEPGQFRPSRFLERDYKHNEFMPFGGGVRRCLGMHLALYELQILLARIATRVELRLCDEEEVRPVRRMVTIAPSGGVRFEVERVGA
ncbi:cytochrome P450 [Persicimonas caeni]|uniref:Cytochrome P450 n=1 Tax=Persicimonas caeni TaxID=2292766 RepID=A0A4Y6PRT0_PERCE|nr:cytochrome P450 [Persicimonas caeni]QDG50727.1 cytochrome P450 [Persicimonas caeni]QED31948.1 cytochrome P450 [Persicimonas caeni]